MSFFARDSEGATAVEFGLLAIPFLMAMFAILETGISMAAQQLLVNATDDVARDVRTGQVKALSQAQLKSRICERIGWMVASGCPGLQVDLRAYPSFKATADQKIYLIAGNIALELDKNGKALARKSEIGGSGAMQSLRAYYFWPLFTSLMQPSMATGGDGKALLSATQTWQNEQY